MGSLPNLHELSNLESKLPPGLKKTPVVSPVRLPNAENEENKDGEGGTRRAVRKVLRARSTGIPTVAYTVDQCVIRQASSYSPVCSARHLVTHHPLLQHQHQHHAAGGTGRRRDSANSSIGATSVRRLITVIIVAIHAAPTDYEHNHADGGCCAVCCLEPNDQKMFGDSGPVIQELKVYPVEKQPLIQHYQ